MEIRANISQKKLRNSKVNRIVGHIPLAWPNCKYLFVIVLLASTTTVWMYPSGAPDSQCANLVPQHGRTVKQEGGVPFQLTVDQPIVNSGETVELELAKVPGASGNDQFKGFIVQGVDQASGKTLGTFVVGSNDSFKEMTCDNVKGSSVTHKSKALKSKVHFAWKAPSVSEDTTVKFHFTLVTGYSQYWVKQPARNLVVVQKSSDDANPEPEGVAEPESETEPEPESETEPEIKYPVRVGPLKNTQHGVSGVVHIINDKKIKVEKFAYDGRAPDAFFYVGKTLPVSEATGTLVPYPGSSSSRVLGSYSGNEDVIITLPGDLKTGDLKWLSVWCKAYSINFGDIYFPEKQAEAQTNKNPIYKDCLEGKGCFGIPDGCVEAGSCDRMSTYSYMRDKRQIKMQIYKRSIQSNQYVAMGLSRDATMGNDLVFSCSSASNAVSARWNTPSRNNDALSGLKIQDATVRNSDGVFICEFTVDDVLSFTPLGEPTKQTFNLAKDKFFLLMAVGAANGDGLTYHDSDKQSSAGAIDLTSNSQVSAALDTFYLIQIHGALMVFAWVASASTGMIMARYYKETWKNVKPCNKDLWFRMHQMFMSLVVVASISAFVVVCIAQGFLPYTFEQINENPHPAVGLACIICACCQPIMAYFRPHPGTSKRWIFDWAHWFVGNSAFLMAVATIFLAVDLPLAELSGRNVEVALIIFVVAHVIVHLVLTIQHCKVRYTKNEVEFESPSMNDPNKDTKGALIRKIVALIYFVFVWIVAISVAVIILMRKSKENYDGGAQAEPEGLSSAEPEEFQVLSASAEAEPEG